MLLSEYEAELCDINVFIGLYYARLWEFFCLIFSVLDGP